MTFGSTLLLGMDERAARQRGHSQHSQGSCPSVRSVEALRLPHFAGVPSMRVFGVLQGWVFKESSDRQLYHFADCKLSEATLPGHG